MAAINIIGFSGLAPRVSEYLLPDNGATDAENVLLYSGEIRPQRGPSWVRTPEIDPPWVSVYRAEWNGDEQWLEWSVDVDVALASLSADVEPRYCWTGDGEPRMALFSGLPSTFYTLGIPKPQTAPGLSVAGGSGDQAERLYCYTFFSAIGEESAPSPATEVVTGYINGTWEVTGMDEFPISSGAATGTFGSGSTSFDVGARHWLRVGDQVEIGGDVLTVSSITDPEVFVVPGNYSAETAWARVAPWNTAGMKRRLYRSAGTNATFQLVDDDVSVDYDDTLSDADILGDELISDTWAPPPTGLSGIFTLPNGAMVGFVGNLVCYSEPYQPHAWPPEYQVGTDFEVVGAAAFGTTVVAATAGAPYVLDGVDPISVTPQKMGDIWPCLSKRGVIAAAGGVLFPTVHGMAYIGPTGADTWTKNLYTREEWSKLNPETMIAGMTDGRLFIVHTPDNSVQRALILHMNDVVALTTASMTVTDLYSDPRDGKLYLVNNTGIYEWNADGASLIPYSWKSKEFTLPTPLNLGAAKVDFAEYFSQADYDQAVANNAADMAANQSVIDAGDIAASFDTYEYDDLEVAADNLIEPRNADDLRSLSFTLYVNGKERFSRSLSDQKPFKLSGGYKGDIVSVRVSGTMRVRAVKLAETMTGLKQV